MKCEKCGRVSCFCKDGLCVHCRMEMNDALEVALDKLRCCENCPYVDPDTGNCREPYCMYDA